MRVKCRSHKFVPQIFIAPYITMHKVLERINKYRINLSRGPFSQIRVNFSHTQKCHFMVHENLMLVSLSTVVIMRWLP